MAAIDLKPLAPAEAVAYFRAKGYRTTFDWRDMWQQEHAYAFTVAKAMRLDILQDIRGAMDKALADGTTFNEFRKTLKPTLQAKGWWGKKEMVDPKTGEEKLVQLGSSRRLQTIYDTNMRTAYAAGKWEQVERTKKTRPYLRYVCVLDGRTRPQHRQWHNVVKHADDPFWDSHYPPCGWNCRCTIQQLSAKQMDRLGLEETQHNPTLPDKNYIDKRNGQLISVPQGVDPGFGYNVGKARMRALTPPQLDTPLDVPFSGPLITVPPPQGQVVSPSKLMPDGLPDEKYIDAFLGQFNTTLGKPVVFKDVTGEPLIVSDDLFRNAKGEIKVTKRDRHRYMLLLASTIKDPDEIILHWQEYPKGRMTLTRTYISRWAAGAGAAGGITLFDVSRAGWRGITSFNADAEAYLKNQRVGTLVYRRPEKK